MYANACLVVWFVGWLVVGADLIAGSNIAIHDRNGIFRKGPACTQLNLVPISPERAASGSYRDGNRTSWGANVLYSPVDGLYHMIVAEMKGNCTLTSWIPSSQIVHAVVS